MFEEPLPALDGTGVACTVGPLELLLEIAGCATGIALPAVTTGAGPEIPLLEGEDDSPFIVKLAHVTMVPSLLVITRLRLPTNTGDPTAVDRN
jgi:hypothetical protein